MDRSSEYRLPHPAPGVLAGSDVFGQALARWVADAVVDEAARARSRSRWLQVQAEESASFLGTLVDLAERASQVVVEVGGHPVRGVIDGLGADFVVVRGERGQTVMRTSAIDMVRSQPGGTEVRGDRSALFDVTLAAVLGPVAADRPDVMVRTGHDTTVRGRLRSAGTDVIGIRVDGDPPTPVWVPLEAITMVVIDP